jgi:signal transduction histidine kinase
VNSHLTIAILYAAVALVHVALGGWALRRQGPAGLGARLLVAGAVLGICVNSLLVAAAAGWLPALPGGLANHLALYGVVAYAAILSAATRLVMRRSAVRRRWLWLLAAALGALAVVDITGETRLVGVGLALLWALVAGQAITLTWQTYRRTPQPLHRNRLAFWALAWALAAAGMALLVLTLTFAGQVIMAFGAVVATVTALRPHLPDARRSIFQALVTGLVLVITVGAYAGLLMWLLNLGDNRLGLVPVAAALLVAVLVAVTLNPLLRLLERWLQQRMAGRRYDPQQLIGLYGLSISNILETSRLATVALGLIRDAIGLARGAVFNVEQVEAGPGAPNAHLYRVATLTEDGPAAGTLLGDSPLARFWRTEFEPLTQYEIDVDPRFAALSTAERVWLGQLGMDVYVPIYADRQWIGLLALGPKRSRHRYFDEDLELLRTLAGQTAVALRNARQVEDLRRLNADLKTANTALDEASRRLTQLDQAKSDFISVISHELRTPLAILYGYAQILTEEIGKAGYPEHVQIVDGMATGVKRLNEVIENMLDMARIDSRALQISAQPVRIEHLVQKLAWQLQWALAERQLQLKSLGLEGLPPVHGDPDALYKAMHHLVTNAVKYTPNGGCITISGRPAPEALRGGALEVTVSDTGIGIDPRFLELIFDKFYQTGEAAKHSSGKTKFKGGGPGLGLAIARGIVEAHGGRVRAESPGHDEQQLPGSRFIVLLPLSQNHTSTAPEG